MSMGLSFLQLTVYLDIGVHPWPYDPFCYAQLVAAVHVQVSVDIGY